MACPGSGLTGAVVWSAVPPAASDIPEPAPASPEWTPAGLRRPSPPPVIEAAAKALRGTQVDAVAVALVARGGSPRVAVPSALTAKAVEDVEEAAAAVRFSAGARDVTRLPSPASLPGEILVLVGLGPDDESGPDTTTLRRAAAAATKSLATVRGIGSLALVLPLPATDRLRAAAEGAQLGLYSFPWYRTTSSSSATETEPGRAGLSRVLLDTTTLRAGGVKRREIQTAVTTATVTAESAWLVRDLVNMAPLDLFPAALAEAASVVGSQAGFSVTVLDEAALHEQGFGGILAVGSGSTRPPRLAVCEYRPRRASAHVVLVGKGITFDSGGLSLKPPTSMPAMKSDMAGAATVLGAIAAAARLGLGVQVTAYLAIAENMPSGSAQRPSDVIRIHGGKTVEVLNTDAEGRLVLADALVAASRTEPDAIVDVATLTGAAVVALGSRTSGFFSNDETLATAVSAAADAAGEPTWRMPLSDDLRSGLDSTVADIANISGKRDAGMITAALFLREFVGNDDAGSVLPWAHMDVAGPAFNDSGAEDLTPKGGTGVPLRTLVRLLESYA